jgi:hypothetical protein
MTPGGAGPRRAISPRPSMPPLAVIKILLISSSSPPQIVSAAGGPGW